MSGTFGKAPVSQAVILVGGIGSRLGHLTADTPKPLLTVGGRPFLDYLVVRCRLAGIRRILFLARQMADQITAYVDRSDGVLGDIRAEVFIEPEPMGTAGALPLARERLDPEFLMMNGDSLFDCDWTALAGRPLDGAVGRLALRGMKDASRYGRVEIADGMVRAFHEKRDDATPGLINGGLYRLSRRVVDFVTAAPCSLESDVFPILVAQGLLQGQKLDGPFIDIGVPEDYERAQSVVPEWTAALTKARGQGA